MTKCFFKFAFFAFLFCASLMLSSCLSDTSYAPVVNAWQEPEAQTGVYRVRKGDTIYSIAWTFGFDYRELAEANDLRPPYDVHSGQVLKMSVLPRQPKVIKTYATQDKQPLVEQKKIVVQPFHETWRWPVRGRIVKRYSSNLAGNRGINIAGYLGEPISAAASGEVVYSGDGVRGYGNLLIIKHSDSYLSAYAYNKKLLVKLGQRVQAGQTIAEMGRNNEGRVVLHFEIRRNGKPVNPEHYISSKL